MRNLMLYSIIFFDLLNNISCSKQNHPSEKSSAPVSEASKKLTLSGQNFSPHEGQTIYVAVIDRSTGNRLALASTKVTGGQFSFSLDNALVENQRHFVDYFADVNGDGKCNPPPLDHVWRLKIDNVNGDMSLNDEHSMNFYDSCASFSQDYQPITKSPTLSLSGTIKLDENIKTTDLTPGQSLAGGSVFIEGLPDQDVISNSSGAFSLKITLDKNDQKLIDSTSKLVMWYTKPPADQDKSPWKIASARFGKSEALSLNDIPSTGKDLGNQALTFTKGIKFNFIDSKSKMGVNDCWIQNPKYGHHLTAVSQGNGIFRINYLPPGTYEFTINCIGYAQVIKSIDVASATDINQWETPPAIELSP